jgi:hypothetical protein
MIRTGEKPVHHRVILRRWWRRWRHHHPGMIHHVIVVVNVVIVILIRAIRNSGEVLMRMKDSSVRRRRRMMSNLVCAGRKMLHWMVSSGYSWRKSLWETKPVIIQRNCSWIIVNGVRFQHSFQSMTH